jgi:TRAP-type C4-dicarboxylate transport system permease small subunit
MMKPMRTWLTRSLSLLQRLEDAVLVGLLTVMIALAVAQILLRNLFEGGILWGDLMVRILVLWLGLLGAMVATRQNQHIRIDIIARFLPERIQRGADALVGFFTAAICAVAAWFGFQFVASELEFGGLAFAGVPVWLCAAIIPMAFAVIALRYLILTALNLRRSVKPGT